MDSNMSINTTSLKTRQQNVLEIVEIYSVGHNFLAAINQVIATLGLFQLFSLSTWRDEHGLKHQIQMPWRIFKFVFRSYTSVTQTMFAITLGKLNIVYYMMISVGQQTLLLFICIEKLYVKWNRLRLHTGIISRSIVILLSISWAGQNRHGKKERTREKSWIT